MAIFKKASVTPIVRTVISQGIEDFDDTPFRTDTSRQPFPDNDRYNALLTFGENYLTNLVEQFGNNIPSYKIYNLIEEVAHRGSLM